MTSFQEIIINLFEENKQNPIAEKILYIFSINSFSDKLN